MKWLPLLLLVACQPAMTMYPPQVLARGELALEYDGRFSMTSEGKTVARGLAWNGLSRFVACSDRARPLAEAAESDGAKAYGFAIAGGILGGASLGALGAFASPDPTTRLAILGSGVGVAILGTVLAALSHRYKNHANGQAIDAMNFYNDDVGSWGGSCLNDPH
jgi:hypothetical protein